MLRQCCVAAKFSCERLSWGISKMSKMWQLWRQQSIMIAEWPRKSWRQPLKSIPCLFQGFGRRSLAKRKTCQISATRLKQEVSLGDLNDSCIDSKSASPLVGNISNRAELFSMFLNVFFHLNSLYKFIPRTYDRTLVNRGETASSYMD